MKTFSQIYGIFVWVVNLLIGLGIFLLFAFLIIGSIIGLIRMI
jgi:hypothetical protein